MTAANSRITLGNAIASLTAPGLPADFNAKVMRALGLRPVFARAAAAEKILAAAASSWLGIASFVAARLLARHRDAILAALLEPEKFLSGAVSYALSCCAPACLIISAAAKAATLIFLKPAGLSILPALAVSSVLAAAAIIFISNPLRSR